MTEHRVSLCFPAGAEAVLERQRHKMTIGSADRSPLTLAVTCVTASSIT